MRKLDSLGYHVALIAYWLV